jgi:trigger factor
MSVETEITELPESKVKITATVPANDVEERLAHAARDFAREMKLPGFRKGKVPPQLVLQRVGRDAVMDQALREGLPEWYERALLESKVTPVGDPKLDMPEPPAEGEPLEFTIEVSVRPKAKLGEYKGLEVGRAEPEVPEEAIDEEIERLRESLAGLQPVERTSANGDYLLIDYAGAVDGEAFEGGTASDYLLELGSDALIEGFNEALEGASAGDERTVELTFPDDYQAEDLAGKPATFKVDVKEVREKTLPELDDDFAADNSDFDTLAELRDDIEHRLEHAFEHRAEHAFRDAAIDAAVENASVEIPEEIIAARAEEIWERVERSLASRGMDPATYLQIQGKDRDEAIADAREDAEAGLRREAVLAAIAEAEDFDVTEEELLEALEPPAGQKGKPEKLLKRLRAEGRDALLVEELRMRKASDLIVDSAEPIEMDRAEAREKLWTPEGERSRGAAAGDLWTPGD